MPKRAGADRINIIITVVILVGVFVSDQISKLLAEKLLVPGQITRVLGSFFQLKLIYNRGGAMGIDLGGGGFYLISSFLILALIIYLVIVNINTKGIAWPLAACAGGAMGNILDRIRLGHVIDFFDVDFFDINIFGRHIERWWTFNIADAAITVGAIFAILLIIFSPAGKNVSRKNDSPDQSELLSQKN
jgi:signal peptidase II